MTRFKRLIAPIGTLPLTLVCLVLMMILVLFGTLAQSTMGTFAAQRQYFSHWIVWADAGSFRVPVLPGGLTVGALWLINLVAAFVVKFRFRREDAGILLSHFGLILLVAGQGLTQIFAVESQMPVQEGATAYYSESPFDSELAVTMVSDPAFDEVVSIPHRFFTKPGVIRHESLPFDLRVVTYYRNVDVQMGIGSLATQGVGTQILVREKAVTHADDERNANSAYVEVLRDGKSLGIWFLSLNLAAPQSVRVDDREYRLAIRPKRIYYPFTITLKDFRHDLYPGTTIPKNFSSLVTINNPERGDNRDALIYMNHPLRYAGSTFFQASFGNENTLSIFQVVQNPAWLTPYISCVIVILGLGVQFLSRLTRHMRGRKAP